MVYKQVAVRKDTFDKLEDCKELFLKHHPQIKGMIISNDKIISRICDAYLEKI